ncbi:MAG: EAL domain-containing protein [Gammaproteobacteria bacterium]|nr:MAG: EAL domain-containing protein [Gammaproteobacteria bacterium]UCH41273.1 MAG: EAL domain-containing protein [Gammaproteobacteria bacterium]
MKAFSYISKSIGLMQALLLMSCAIVIGLALSAWETRSALGDQREYTFEHVNQLLDLSLSGASSAAWALDDDLANEIVAGVIKQEGVVAVEIYADLRVDTKRLLSRQEKPSPSSDELTDWVARKYFADLTHSQRDLYVIQQGKQVDVGDMVVQIAPVYGAQKFLAIVYSILTVSLMEAFLIGIVLLLVAQWLVTAPIRRAAAKISRLNPDALEDTEFSIEIPGLHKSDELGLLFNHTNQLLDRLVESQTALRTLATRDPLTGLPNRALIKESVTTTLANAQRNEQQVAVIFIDLDRFKSVNDTLGHEIGDKLLIRVANTLLAQIREQDSIGRLGGDEFLVVMPVHNVNDVVVVVRRIIDAMAHPFEIDGIDLRTSASIGIAVFPDDGTDADVLMRRADLAMYKAKADATTRWQLFSQDMGQAVDAGVLFETALANAVLRNELEFYLQPKFEGSSMKLAGSEALLRWQYEGRSVAPDKFIGLAESSGLIREIGDWVIVEACQTLKRWQGHEISISVNVSARQLADDGFARRIMQTVQRHGVSPALLGFEITESTLMQDLDQSFEQLTALRDYGFRISIDDFGTGYSSLSYLTRLPIDELKIDRSFVSGAQHSAIVLSTIIAMARALQLEVVAEGVETETQRDQLQAAGCDQLQGFLLGKPMPVTEFETRFGIVEAETSASLGSKIKRIK